MHMIMVRAMITLKIMIMIMILDIMRIAGMIMIMNDIEPRRAIPKNHLGACPCGW